MSSLSSQNSTFCKLGNVDIPQGIQHFGAVVGLPAVRKGAHRKHQKCWIPWGKLTFLQCEKRCFFTATLTQSVWKCWIPWGILSLAGWEMHRNSFGFCWTHRGPQLWSKVENVNIPQVFQHFGAAVSSLSFRICTRCKVENVDIPQVFQLFWAVVSLPSLRACAHRRGQKCWIPKGIPSFRNCDLSWGFRVLGLGVRC